MKYKLTENTKEINGTILYQIQALKDFIDVKAGDLGGWIEKESNLSQEGNCWVSENARVFENAWVSENARIYENAKVYGVALVYGNAKVFENARVFENAQVSGVALVYGNAKVFENARVFENAQVSGDALVSGNVWVAGNAKVSENIKSQSKGTKNMKFTAKEALELAQSKNLNLKVENAVNTLLDRVKQAADKGQYYIETRDYEFGSGKCYCYEQDYPEICKQILQELKSLGFKCTVCAEEKQFVDMWLEISWKDD